VRTDVVARHELTLKRKWVASNPAIVFVMKINISRGENPLVRDRTITYAPRPPFTFVLEIPRNTKEKAGRATGGVWGGMSPCPQPVVCDDAISLTETDFGNLRQFLLKVRTWFSENPEQ